MFSHCPSCACHIGSTAQSLEEIDLAIEQLISTMKNMQDSLSYLRTLHNSYFSVNKLPSELLAEVFWWYRLRQGQSSCLRLLGVCRAWRTAALACQKLWVTIDCKQVHQANVFLQLSGAAPLYVRLRIPDKDNVHASPSLQEWRQIANHGSRFRSLIIRFKAFKASDVDEYFKSLDQPGERLTELILDNDSYEWGFSEEKTSRLQALLFCGRLTQLKKLTIIATPWPWNPAYYHGLADLTALTLRIVPGDWTAAQILGCLECLPLLRHLELHCSLGYSNEPLSLRSHPPISLPNLQYFCVDENVDMIVLVLQGLRLPLECRVDLPDVELEDDEDACGALILELQKPVKEASSAKFRINYEYTSFSFHFYAESNALEDEKGAMVKVDAFFAAQNEHHKIHAFRALLSPTNLHTLTLHCTESANHREPRGFLTTLLAGLEGVRTLIIEEFRGISDSLFHLVSGALPHLNTLVVQLVPSLGNAHEEAQIFQYLAMIVEAKVRLGGGALFNVRVVDDREASAPTPGERLGARLSEIAGCMCEVVARRQA